MVGSYFEYHEQDLFYLPNKLHVPKGLSALRKVQSYLQSISKSIWLHSGLHFGLVTCCSLP